MQVEHPQGCYEALYVRIEGCQIGNSVCGHKLLGFLGVVTQGCWNTGVLEYWSVGKNECLHVP
jgi:hypothetical protein